MELLRDYLKNFNLCESLYENDLFSDSHVDSKAQVKYLYTNGVAVPQYINEYWTAKQRQGNAIHEITYRACFKPQLPRFFINLLTKEHDIVYDPFSGRGTTALEAALCGRRFVANDINPLSTLLAKPRVRPPTLADITQRVYDIDFEKPKESDMDLSMFFHIDTLHEILCLKEYLSSHTDSDYIDDWIRMVATNRLTGHSKGFFSVYTLPPNQAVSPEKQKKINTQRNQTPPYKNTKEIIIKKSHTLLRDINDTTRTRLHGVADQSTFLNADARLCGDIPDESIALTVTSPPFLNIVQYAQDNWLRCWFNMLDIDSISQRIVMAKTTADWCDFIEKVFADLYRVTKRGGHVAFEVGEVRHGKILLDEYVTDIGIKVGFKCIGILINTQAFTKTANIWGVENNKSGTNTNRIVLFRKI
jgi:DNA modification methylase